ncbi:tyrosine-type recombinase/integrase [Alkalimarinus coralli]|uniref:tyrosine-type recombinase/integrase n=1 Tax=Alkalimarinus coralli TaxID=2935863 RepID=UPI00202AE4F7|nr:site-specific integrase [Alkalimarinus coralli]
MTPLRQKMIDLMLVKRFSPRTQQSYLYSVQSLAQYYHCSPDQLGQDEIQRYLIYLVKEKNLAANSCRLQLNGIRFFFHHVLKRPPYHLVLHYPRRPLQIPELLSRSEALRIVNAPQNLKHRTQLKLCYGCGLRVSEVVAVRIKDIDGERQLLRVEQGKGAKDRFVPLSPRLLEQLREYWRHYRPREHLFDSNHLGHATGVSTVQRVYTRSKKQAGVTKKGGIHALRHAFATQQLEAGLPIHLLQCWLGHKDIHTTMRYVHWVPHYQAGRSCFADLLDKGGYHAPD